MGDRRDIRFVVLILARGGVSYIVSQSSPVLIFHACPPPPLPLSALYSLGSKYINNNRQRSMIKWGAKS